jgi:hypothetical protein
MWHGEVEVELRRRRLRWFEHVAMVEEGVC